MWKRKRREREGEREQQSQRRRVRVGQVVLLANLLTCAAGGSSGGGWQVKWGEVEGAPESAGLLIRLFLEGW